jgi:Bacterial Ig-like domain (group 2)
MSSTKQKLRLAFTFAMLVTLALTISCTGFFVNPTLTAVSVGPSGLNLTVNQTFQMTATGTFSDGTQNTLTSGVVWSSDAASIVSVGSNSGLVDGLQIGSANITASSGGCSSCSGSTSVTVVLNNVTSITVNPGSATAKINSTAAAFTATAQPGSVDITQNATWKVFDSTNTDQTANFSISFVAGQGESFLPGTNAVAGTYSVVASYSSTTITGKATLNVTQ